MSRSFPALLILVAIATLAAPGAAADAPWFSRVLITNDDGIDDPRIGVLARAFAEVAQVVVIAPRENCSGSSNYCSVFQKGRLITEPREMGAGITAYAVDGFPGDCVVLALEAVMKDDPPDLVISGVNSGPNLADAWIASGTIGAARLAAHYGYRAIAVSSLDDDDPAMMTAAAKWCVDLAVSEAVVDLAPPRYLSVNLPRVAPDAVAGVVWAPVGKRFFHDDFHPAGPDADGRITWVLDWWLDDRPQPAGSDVERYRKNFITVTPLRVDERDGVAGDEHRPALPEWGESRK